MVWKVDTNGMKVHLKDELASFMLGKLIWFHFLKGFFLKEKLRENLNVAAVLNVM